MAVDLVIFTIRHGDLRVLLIQRGRWPYAGRWALPGGFVRERESLEEAARRVLEEKTGVGHVYLEQLHAFGDPDRDPRRRVITVAYCALIASEELKVRPDADAAGVGWFSVYELPPLAFDHDRILTLALERLRDQLMYTNIAFQLMPRVFTLTELQTAYEVILGKELDKRNFRKRILNSGVLEATGDTRMDGRHRPARLYRFSAGEPA